MFVLSSSSSSSLLFSVVIVVIVLLAVVVSVGKQVPVHGHTAVKRKARAQFPPKLSLNKVLNFRKFSLLSPKLRPSLKS